MSPLTYELAPPTLIRTKLQPPNLPATLVPLPRLFAQLDSGYRAGITLVSAPTGYGKTTIVAAWLQDRAQQSAKAAALPAAWLSLDAEDDSLPRFLAYVCASIEQLFPGMVLQTRTRLVANGFGDPEEAAAALIADLDDVPDHFVLVLDDFHLIRVGGVQRLVAVLLRKRPRRCHLVLIARTDPAVAVAHLRAQGKLVDLRARDLRFTLLETSDFVHSHADVRLTSSAIKTLLQQTEGWVAGLHLAMLALHDVADGEGFIQTIPAKHEFVTQYLLEEVFARQTPAIQRCLLQTSILTRFSADLIEAVADCGHTVRDMGPAAEYDTALPLARGRDLINQLLAAGLFVIPLDNENGWYRYHHLFSDFLRDRLQTLQGAGAVAELHLCASNWFAAAGLIDEAVTHALAAGDVEKAADIVEIAATPALAHEQFPVVMMWLGMLPQAIVGRRARLVLLRCWLHVNRWRMDEMRSLLPTVELLIADAMERPENMNELRALAGELAGLRCIASCLANDSVGSLGYGYQALAQITPAHGFALSTVKMFVALALQMSGDLDDAYDFLSRELLLAQSEAIGLDVRLLTGLEFVTWQAGDLVHLEQAATIQYQRARARKMTASEGWSHLFRGMIHYARNQLAEAAEALSCFAAQYTDGYNNGAWINGVYWFAITLERMGEHARATQVAEFALKIAIERSHARMIASAHLMRRHLALLRGDLAAATQGAFDWNPPDVYPLSFFAERDLIQVLYLLAVGTQADLRTAKKILDSWLQYARSAHMVRRSIEVLALRTAICQAMGNPEVALADLREALGMAEPRGLVRYFADVGLPILPVFEGLNGDEQGRPFVRQIVSALAAAQPYQPTGPTGAVPVPTRAALLTAREMDVLLLMNQRLSDKEIAGHLYISVPTVKRHTANIYQKLYVSGRREAVAAAHALGLLSVAAN